MPTAERVDPVAGFRFAVEIGGILQGWFTDCGGLNVTRKTETHKEGGVNDYVHQLPAGIEYSNVTLKRGIADNALWDWFQKGLYDGKVERRSVSIILYNQDHTKAKRWNLTDAYPVKWTGPDLKTDSSQAAIETLELVHHGMEMTDWTNT
jgi:phage tail-like protein